MNLIEMFFKALESTARVVQSRSPWQRKVKGREKSPGIRIERTWITFSHEPDRSRGKKFRSRPRSKRGHYEWEIKGAAGPPKMTDARWTDESGKHTYAIYTDGSYREVIVRRRRVNAV